MNKTNKNNFIIQTNYDYIINKYQTFKFLVANLHCLPDINRYDLISLYFHQSTYNFQKFLFALFNNFIYQTIQYSTTFDNFLNTWIQYNENTHSKYLMNNIIYACVPNQNT